MALSQTAVMKLYAGVIDDVISGVRDFFLDEGVDEQVLQELKQVWEGKLQSSKAVELPTDPPEAHPPPIVTNSHKANGNKTGAVKKEPSVVSQQTLPVQHVAPQPQQSKPIGNQATSQQPLPATSVTLDPARMVPIQITLPAQPNVENSSPRVLTIQVPASALQGNQLHQVLTGPVITATMGLPPHLASSLLQQHVNSALQGHAQAHAMSANKALTVPKPISQLDGPQDSTDEDLSDASDDALDGASDDDNDKDDDDGDEADGGAEEEPLNSEDDVTDDDPTDLFETDNVIVCQYDKITRSKNKWKFYLKDGIMNLNGKDYVFQRSNVTSKIRSLYDFQLRLLNGVMPAPLGGDIANTIKYFSQTLLTVLKDVPGPPMELLRSPGEDAIRMALYPSLDYKGLYNALVTLLDVASLVTVNQQDFGLALLQCFGCLLPFLDHDMIDNLPFLTASCMAALPPSLHQNVINTLCFYILPFTITRHSDEEQESQASQSISSVIMLVFQYSAIPAHHCQLLECLMTLKQNVVKDLLCVIAYGTAAARASAAKLLFYYWPAFNANLFDRKGLLCKFANDLVPFVCQRDNCSNAGNAEAAKVCYDHCISIAYAGNTPPPLYLCIECANEIHREHPDQLFNDVLHPMQQVSMICENKNCRATDKSAVSICFSTECASYNGNHPIRYCQQCHGNRHNNRRGGDHVVHRSLPPAWQMDAEMQTYMVEAIISLLKEAKPLNLDTSSKEGFEVKLIQYNGPVDNISLEERQLLGRYGVWLLVGLCSPTPDTSLDTLGRLISMLFHWFHVTAYSFNGQVESTLEKLKEEHVCPWLGDICRTHYKLFTSCLLPHPPEYARVGGHWDTLASRTSHLKDGLHRLFCLVPYDIIDADIWDYIMPHWMEAITNDVPEKELIELKIVLSKILDPDMSPLGFDAKKMYHFVAIRFEQTTAKVQQQALHWLQILTMLNIMIPLQQLFTMFGDGVRIMKHGVTHETTERPKHTKNEYGARRSSISPVIEDESGNTSALSDDEGPHTSRHTEFATDAEHNLTCCILMLDILLKQMELQDVEQHMGITTSVCRDVSRLLKCMVTAAWIGNHACSISARDRGSGAHECSYCEASIMWHQLAARLASFMAPKEPAHSPDPPLEDPSDDSSHSRKSPPDGDGKGGGGKGSQPQDVIINIPVPVPEIHSVGGVLVHMPHVCSIMTATVETVSEQLDLAAIMPSEKVVCAVARSVTLSEADVATATVQVAKAQIVGENEQPVEPGPDDDLEDFWHTSVGKFRFSLDELPQYLQYIHQLLKELPNTEKPDILYYMLQCLNVMVLNGDAFTKAAKDHRGFFIWCQENLLIKNLWELCNAEHSHICQVCVPLLLHCITLRLGLDVFWKVIQEDFHSTDWRVRFVAVERVTVITRFMDSTPLRNVLPLQTALANAFCYLISAMDDSNVHIAQRATLYLGTIHDNAIKSLLLCLETQFDLVIVDRPMVLQSIYQLHNSLSDRNVLTWEFFLNRFDTLFLEAQINLERSGDISYLRDLRNSEANSEVFMHKLRRAHEALSQSDGSGAGSSVKTLSASFGTKWPYKRTMSAPASIIPRHDVKMEKEKIYNRQYSAPILKRKSSRFGLGQLLGGGGATQPVHAQQTYPSNNTQGQGGQFTTVGNNTSALPGHTPPGTGTSDGHIHSLSGPGDACDPALMAGFLHRVIDLEEADRETVHLLVFLFMQFLSRADQAHPSEDKHLARTQHIVLRHLYLLLGYSANEKGFHVSPARLRSSAVFNVFLSNLPQLFDQNHLMGVTVVPTALALLLFCPSPIHCNSQLQATTQHSPTYSLWYLEPHVRRNWLMALLVLLYKYQYNQPPLSHQLQPLVRIVLNTLDSQFHQCKRIPATVVMDAPPSRSRDVSQPSLGNDGDHLSGGGGEKYETPPLSPMFPGDGPSHVTVSTKGKVQAMFHGKGGAGATGGVVATSTGMETHWEESIKQKSFNKYQQSSIEADETDSELVAIHESEISDSTLHGNSAPGSFDDPLHFDELCAPLKPEIVRNKAMAQITTANLATAHVAMSTLATSHQPMVHQDNRTVIQKDNMKPNADGRKPTWFMGSEEANLQSQAGSKCSVQEGVRMMVTPSMLQSKPSMHGMLQPLATIHRATVVTQAVHNNHQLTSGKVDKHQKVDKQEKPTKTMGACQMMAGIAGIAAGQVKTLGGIVHQDTSSIPINALPKAHVLPSVGGSIKKNDSNGSGNEAGCTSNNWQDLPRQGSPVPRPLGRQKRIIEPSITPACTPVSAPRTGGSSPVQHTSDNVTGTATEAPSWQYADLHSAVTRAANIQAMSVTHADRLNPIGHPSRTPVNKSSPRFIKSEYATYASPESPLSKMDIMTVGSPGDAELGVTSGNLSPRSISQLEIPTQERLLPIGQHGKDGITYLVEKVREALGMPEEKHELETSSDRDSNKSSLKQESLDKSSDQTTPSPIPPVTNVSGKEDALPSRGASPRRLIKQVALESPPHTGGPGGEHDGDDVHSAFYRAVNNQDKRHPGERGKTEEQIRSQRQRLRKVGPFTIGTHAASDIHTRRAGSWCGMQRDDSVMDVESQEACHAAFDLKQSSFRIGEDCVVERCSECGTMKEEYSDEELGLCIIVLGTYIHREPALAAPYLPEILTIVSKVALNPMYPWQQESNIHLPGGATSVAHQFLRCVLHQLAPNGVFVQIFHTERSDKSRMQFFKSVAQALQDFNELNQVGPLQLLFESLNSKKTLSPATLHVVLHNVACYLDCLPLEAGLGPVGPASVSWAALLGQLDTLFRKIVLVLPGLEDVEPLLRIMVAMLKVPGISQFKAILDPFSKILSYAIQNFVLKYSYLVDLCYLCNRSFSKERDKLLLCRMVVFELVQALKFKTSIPDSNFLLLLSFVLQDAGGFLPLTAVLGDGGASLCPPDSPAMYAANISDCMRTYMNDVLEFLADFHTLSKIKSYCKGATVGLNEDTLGGVLKGGVAQYLALEMTRGNSRDNRAVSRYLPWLYNAPSSIQQGPREFTECVGHMRILSWLLLGALTHTALQGTNRGIGGGHHSTGHVVAQPVPQEASCHISDHIQVILSGFAEQSKASVLHMSSLFHAFTLCQLWTVYLEQNSCSSMPTSEAYNATMSVLFDFWGKVTPCILQLIAHSKVLAEMVNYHFLSLLESLREVNSIMLSKLLPMWSSVLFAHNVQIAGHLQVRLQACRDNAPNISPDDKRHEILLKWLQRLQFKMGQIETQSSTATQFYSI